MSQEGTARRLDLLTSVYGPAIGRETAISIEHTLDQIRTGSGSTPGGELWSHDDVWLISYADQFQARGQAPLATLANVLEGQLAGMVNGVHILPFHPWSSDDGFSVIDYGSVDHRYGDWSDVERIGRSCRLMVDAVVNHVSSESEWFRRFLADEEPYNTFFPCHEPTTDVSRVVRPRTHPLLTPFQTKAGERWVWTTFSPDQVDLDYRNPLVLREIIDVLLNYVAHGASVMRLDAIGFLWKDPRRSSIHLPETHSLVQLMRSCLDDVAPGTVLISETNVPHVENISYFHHDPPEVHAVYQFALPPLVAHAALTGDTTSLVAWADEIGTVVQPGQSFLNFLSSHDGVGLRPAEGLLDDDGLDLLVTACLAGGGRISYRSTAEGSTKPYELNTTWFDLMTFQVHEEAAIARHLATHAVLLALPGVAGLYVHSLFGSSNDHAGYKRTGQNRAVSRARFLDSTRHFAAIAQRPDGRASRIMTGLQDFIRRRRANPAFHPEGACAVRTLTGSDILIERRHDGHRGGCVVNLSGNRIELPVEVGGTRTLEPWFVGWFDAD